jgi:diguanylate cyclase (GGDEF)-like protein
LTLAIHPHVEDLISTIISLTGHEVAVEPVSALIRDDAHRWELIDSSGQRLGVLAVRGGALSDPHRELYANLSRVIAHESELRRSHRLLEDRFRKLDQHAVALEAQQHALSAAAYRDSLTAVYRPWYLSEQIRLELARARRHQRAMSLVLFDIDRLDDANDRFGRRGGDDILRAFAARLTATCRTSDVIARIGGDEFCALLPDTSAAGATELIRRFRRTLDETPITLGVDVVALDVVTATITCNGSETPEGLLERGRQKLHREKHNRM